MTEKKSDLVAQLEEAHERGGFEPRIFEQAASALRDLEIQNEGLADMIARDVATKLKSHLMNTLDAMEKTLAFYADEANYGPDAPVQQDRGELARAVLSQYEDYGPSKEAAPSSDPPTSSA